MFFLKQLRFREMISNNKEGGKSKSFFYPEIFGRAQHDQHDRWLRHWILHVNYVELPNQKPSVKNYSTCPRLFFTGLAPVDPFCLLLGGPVRTRLCALLHQMWHDNTGPTLPGGQGDHGPPIFDANPNRKSNFGKFVEEDL